VTANAGPTTSSPDVQARIDAYWSARAEGYHGSQEDRLVHGDVRAAWERVWTAALPAPPAEVLEPGTGTGHVASLLARLGYDVLGTDLAEGMIGRARRSADEAAAVGHPVPRFEVGDAVRPDLPSASVDAVVARYLLWTLREPVTALSRWREVLRPGGVLAVVDALWFRDGFPAGGDEEEVHGASTASFRDHYADDVLAALPLATAGSIERTAEVVRAAGFVDVEVTPLPELLELDHRHGVAPGHRPELQHLIRGVAPSA
jgi:SAM-dependent methyltransferase